MTEQTTVTMPIERYTQLIEADTKLAILAEAMFKIAELEYNDKKLRFNGYDTEIIFKSLFPMWYDRVLKSLVVDKNSELNRIKAKTQEDDKSFF